MQVYLHKLDEDDPNYKEVSRLFLEDSDGKSFSLSLLSIQRLENYRLLEAFKSKKIKYRQMYGHVRVVKVFHGTKKANIPHILLKNLEVRRHGENIGHRFGCGVSFSAFSSYSSHYCDFHDGYGQMLLCYVLVSNITNVAERKGKDLPLFMPPYIEDSITLRYDTTAKNKETMDVIVKFEDHTFFPRFLIHFKKVSKLKSLNVSSALPNYESSLSQQRDKFRGAPFIPYSSRKIKLSGRKITSRSAMLDRQEYGDTPLYYSPYVPKPRDESIEVWSCIRSFASFCKGLFKLVILFATFAIMLSILKLALLLLDYSIKLLYFVGSLMFLEFALRVSVQIGIINFQICKKLFLSGSRHNFVLLPRKSMF